MAGRNRLIGDAEIADVQFVQNGVAEAVEGGFGQRVPTVGQQVGIGQIDDLAALAVGREAEGVRVGYEIVDDAAFGGHENFNFVQIKLAIPIGLAGDRPDAGFGINAHRHDVGAGRWPASANRCSLTPRAVGAQTRRWTMRHAAIFVSHAQRAIVGVQIIQNAGDLQAGGGQRGRPHWRP